MSSKINNNFIIMSVCTFIVQINIQYIFKQLWQLLRYRYINSINRITRCNCTSIYEINYDNMIITLNHALILNIYCNFSSFLINDKE